MIFFSDSTSLYVFSALLQANAAILSIAAIFVIFRIQSLGSAIEVRRSILADFTRPPDVRTSVSQIAEFESMPPTVRRQWLTANHGGVFQAYCLPHFQAWADALDEIARVKVLIVLVFGVGMACAFRLHTLSVRTEALCLLSALAIEAICLAVVVRAIFALLDIRLRIHVRRLRWSRFVSMLFRRQRDWVIQIDMRNSGRPPQNSSQDTKEAS